MADPCGAEKTVVVAGRRLVIAPTWLAYCKLLSKVPSLHRVLLGGCRTAEDFQDMLDVIHISVSTGAEIVSRAWLKDNVQRSDLNEILELIGAAYLGAAARRNEGRA